MIRDEELRVTHEVSSVGFVVTVKHIPTLKKYQGRGNTISEAKIQAMDKLYKNPPRRA